MIYRFLSPPCKKCGTAALAIAAIGTAISAGVSAISTSSTNSANKELNEENNEFNAEQAELNREFEAEQADITRDYNSLVSQVERAKQAGVSPAAVANSGSTAVTSVPSGSQASSSGLPHLSNPMQGLSQFTNFLNQLPLLQSQIANMDAETNKVNAETDAQLTYNEFASRIHQSGLDLTNSQVAENYSNCCQIDENIKQIQQQVEYLKQQGKLVDAQAAGQAIENYYKSDECQALISKLKSETGLNDAQANAIMQKLPFELLGLQADANYKNAAANLSVHEANQVDMFCTLLGTQNEQSRWNLLLDKKFSIKERQEGLSSLEWNNSTLNRGVSIGKDIVLGASSAVGALSIGGVIGKAAGSALGGAASSASKVVGFGK